MATYLYQASYTNESWATVRSSTAAACARRRRAPLLRKPNACRWFGRRLAVGSVRMPAPVTI